MERGASEREPSSHRNRFGQSAPVKGHSQPQVAALEAWLWDRDHFNHPGFEIMSFDYDSCALTSLWRAHGPEPVVRDPILQVSDI